MEIFSPAEIWEYLKSEFGKVLGGVLVGALLTVLGLLGGLLYKLYQFFHRLWRAHRDVGRVRNKYGKPVEGRGLWLADPIRKPDPQNYQLHVESAKILTIANLKGGVSKTTLAANLGAYLSTKLTKPVLLIDLDFQGSLSAMACPSTWIPKSGDSEATQLISGDLTDSYIANIKHHALNFPNLFLIGSYYDLTQAENRIMVEWLIGARKTDVRYTSAKVLHTRTVRDRYSLIIIDAPPRLTTGSIQAICASSHLLIPTIMDRPSADAVVRFVRQIETFKGTKAGTIQGRPLNPYIKHLGVVGTMMNETENVAPIEVYLRDVLGRNFDDEGANSVTSLVDDALYFHRSRFIRQPGKEGIAYAHLGAQAADIQRQIEALGDFIAQRMHLTGG
jgi:chromosome partitioning protein